MWAELDEALFYSRGSFWWVGWLIFPFLCRYVWYSTEQSGIFWWRFLPASLWKPSSQIQCWMNHQDSTSAGWNPSMLCETFCSDTKYILRSWRLQPSEPRWHQEGRIWYMELFRLTPSGLQSVSRRRWTWQSKNAVKAHLEQTWYFFAAFIVRIPPIQISSDSFAFCRVRCECACVCLCVCVGGEGHHYLVHSQLKN